MTLTVIFLSSYNWQLSIIIIIIIIIIQTEGRKVLIISHREDVKLWLTRDISGPNLSKNVCYLWPALVPLVSGEIPTVFLNNSRIQLYYNSAEILLLLKT